MTKIYIVVRSIVYEGDEILDVYASKEDAEVTAKLLRKNIIDGHETIGVEEWELN